MAKSRKLPPFPKTTKLDNDRRSLAESMIGRIRPIARRYWAKSNYQGDFDEIESCTQWGLIQAASSYDESRERNGWGFSRYATLRMCIAARFIPYRMLGRRHLSLDERDDDGQLITQIIDDSISAADDGLDELRASMLPEEWKIVDLIVFSDYSITEAAHHAGVTVERALELYESAGAKTKEWYEQCRGANGN